MLIRVSNQLNRLSTGWVVLISTLIFILFMGLVLPNQAAQSDQVTNGAPAPDTSFFYTAKDLYQMAEMYGETGRSAYIRARFTFDLIWPLVYTLFLTSLISWLSKQALPAGNRWQYLNLVPVVGMLLDYMENISTSVVMARFPAQTPVVDFLAPLFTLLKWVFVYGSFVIPFVFLIILLIKKFKKR